MMGQCDILCLKKDNLYCENTKALSLCTAMLNAKNINVEHEPSFLGGGVVLIQFGTKDYFFSLSLSKLEKSSEVCCIVLPLNLLAKK